MNRKGIMAFAMILVLAAFVPLTGIAEENKIQSGDVHFGDQICANAGKQYQWPGIVTAVYRSGVVVVDTWYSSLLSNVTKGQCKGKVETDSELPKTPLVMYGLSNTFGEKGSNVNISVNFINNLFNDYITGLMFDIVYDNKTLNLIGIERGSLTSGWDMKFNRSTGRVILIDNQTMIGKTIGTVAVLRFRVLTDITNDSQIYIKTGKDHDMYIANQEGKIDLIKGNVGYVYNATKG